MQLNEKIRLLREERALSQKDVAEKLKMSVNGYSKIERGETQPNMPRLQQIAQIFDVPIYELMPQTNGQTIVLINEGRDHYNHQHIYNSPQDLAVEIEKLKLIIQHKDELLAQQARELSHMQQILELMKQR